MIVCLIFIVNDLWIALLVYMDFQPGFFIAFGRSDSMQQPALPDFSGKWFDKEQNDFPLNYEGVNNFNQIWSLILAIDIVIAQLSTIFLKKKPAAYRTFIDI